MLLKLLSLCVVVAMASGQNALPAHLQSCLDEVLLLPSAEQQQFIGAILQAAGMPMPTMDAGMPDFSAYGPAPDGSMPPSPQDQLGSGKPPPQFGMPPPQDAIGPSTSQGLSIPLAPVAFNSQAPPPPPPQQASQAQFARPAPAQVGQQMGPPQFQRGPPTQQFGQSAPFGRGRPSSIMNAFGPAFSGR